MPVIKPLKAHLPVLDLITSTDSFFDNVKHDFNDLLDSGFFEKNKDEALYVYRQTDTRGQAHLGLLGCIDISGKKNKIIPHEHTLASKEQRMLQLTLKRGALVKPVLLTYTDVPKISKLLQKWVNENPASFHLKYYGEMHEFWAVTDKEFCKDISNLFEKKVPHTYIADGHHRVATTKHLMEKATTAQRTNYNELLCAFFSSNQLDIHDFNRLVEGMNGMTPAGFMARLSDVFNIKILDKAFKPIQKHSLTLYFQKEWFLLTWKDAILKTATSIQHKLDVSLFNKWVLEDLLGIEDVRLDKRVRYIEGPKGLQAIEEKVDLNPENRMGFCLYPIHIREFMAIADAGEVLPPKSTWFEPRIRNGFIVKKYD